MNTKLARRREWGSCQTSRSAVQKSGGGAAREAAACALRAAPRGRSTPQTARQVTRNAPAATTAVTSTRRPRENGSSISPTMTVVTMKPAIIITQVTVAAAARRVGATLVEISTNSAVPQAPTPSPTATNASTDNAMPRARSVGIKAVASVAPTAPAPSTAMPPMIHGVRRPPISEP